MLFNSIENADVDDDFEWVSGIGGGGYSIEFRDEDLIEVIGIGEQNKTKSKAERKEVKRKAPWPWGIAINIKICHQARPNFRVCGIRPLKTEKIDSQIPKRL